MKIEELENTTNKQNGNLIQFIINLQKFSAAGQIFSDFTHELNNIVGAMLGYAQIAKMTNEENDKRKCIEIVISCSEKVKMINNNILAYIRRNPQDICEVDINFIIKQSISLTTKIFDRKGIKIIFEQGSIPIVNLKLGLFQQAFLNLLLDIKKKSLSGNELNVATGFNKEQKLIEIGLRNDSCDIIDKKCYGKIIHFKDIFGDIDILEDFTDGFEAEIAYWILEKEIGGGLIVNKNKENGSGYIIKIPA